MRVKSLNFNWHQVGSTVDRDGCGENYHVYEVGKHNVSEIIENKPCNGLEVWNYEVRLKTGETYRVFNPNFVEYFKLKVMPKLEQEVKTYSDSDRKATQSVSIDYDEEEKDNWIIVHHNGEELSMSLKNWNKLIELFNKTLKQI